MTRPANYRTALAAKRFRVGFAVVFVCIAGNRASAFPQQTESVPVVASAQPVHLDELPLPANQTAPRTNASTVGKKGSPTLSTGGTFSRLSIDDQFADEGLIESINPAANPELDAAATEPIREVPHLPFSTIDKAERLTIPLAQELSFGLDLIESPSKLMEDGGNAIPQAVDLRESQPATINASEWRLFDDPILQEMIDRVVSQNPSVRDSQARITQARSIYQQARANLFPQVNATTQYGFRRFSQNGNAFVQDSSTTQGFDWYSGGLDTRWEVDLFGRLRSLRNAAGLETDAAKQDCRDVMLSLVGDLMLAYIEFSLANERIRIAVDNLTIQERILAIAQERRRIGEEGDLVVMQAQNQVDMTRTLIPGIQEQRATALHRLMVLQGFGMETPTAPAHWGIQLPQMPTHLPIHIDGELLARRPDIRSNRLAVMAQAERVGASRAEYYPKLMLNGSVSLETRDLSVWWDERSLAHSVGPVMSLNLLDFGRLRAGVNSERSKYAQAVARYEQSVLDAVEEVRNAMASSDAQRAKTTTLDTAAKSALSVVEMATVEYQEGMTNFQNVLDAERQLLSIQDQRAVAHGTALIAYARLFKALGGTWVEGLPGEAGLIHDSMNAESVPVNSDLVP